MIAAEVQHLQAVEFADFHRQRVDSIVLEPELFQLLQRADFPWDRAQPVVGQIDLSQAGESVDDVGVDVGLCARRQLEPV